MTQWIYEEHPTADPPKCDFCSLPAVTTCFVGRDATIGMDGDEPIEVGGHKVKRVILDSDAHWAACEACAGLVRAGERDELRERCFDRAPAEIKGSPSGMAALRMIQDSMFWAGFSGLEHPASEHGPDGKLLTKKEGK